MNKKLNRMINNSWIELCARWILGLVFMYAGFLKIIDPAGFAKIIYGYDLSPDYLINFIAIVLPMIELLSGAALFFGVWPKSAVLVLNFLLLVFIVLISINMIRDYQFDCGCLSTDIKGNPTSPESLIIRDFLLLFMGLQVLFYERDRKLCIIPQ